MSGESVDKALEVLFYKYFDVDPQQKPENIPTTAELLEMRMDEKAVLESIYDTSFQVKDNNIWTVKLHLDYLTNLYEKKDLVKRKEPISKNSNFKTKKKEVCKLFLRGPCRFGDKCKFSHETKVQKEVKEVEKVDDTEKITYELEVRFPDETIYPYQVPMLFFKTEHKTSTIPELTCLKVTARLVDEAKVLAQDGIPSIYSIVELLNNEEDITNFIQFDTRTFPIPTDVLFPQLIEDTEDPINRPTHYKKGESKNNRSEVNFEKLYRENEEIAKWWAEKRDNNRYAKMMSGRRKLPAWQKRKEILNTMQQSQV